MLVFYGNIIHSSSPEKLEFLSPGCLLAENGQILDILEGDAATVLFLKFKNDPTAKVLQYI